MIRSIVAAVLLVSSVAFAGTAFFSYETNDDGMYKQCVYDYLGEPYVITIKSIKLCPLTIPVN